MRPVFTTYNCNSTATPTVRQLRVLSWLPAKYFPQFLKLIQNTTDFFAQKKFLELPALGYYYLNCTTLSPITETSSSGISRYRRAFRAISLVIARPVKNHSLLYTCHWRHCTSKQRQLPVDPSTRYQNIYNKKLRYWKFSVSLPILVNVLPSVSTCVFTFCDVHFYYDSLNLFSITDWVIFFFKYLITFDNVR